MPFTPFHFGPGILVKSVTPKQFSLSAFILIQIVIDCEVLLNLFFGHSRLHTLFHSYLGSTLAVLLSALLLYGFSYFSRLTKWKYSLNFKAVGFGLFLGAWSHVFLDSIMHADLMPFYPFSESQPLLKAVSLIELHGFCVVSLLAGVCSIKNLERFL